MKILFSFYNLLFYFLDFLYFTEERKIFECHKAQSIRSEQRSLWDNDYLKTKSWMIKGEGWCLKVKGEMTKGKEWKAKGESSNVNGNE